MFLINKELRLNHLLLSLILSLDYFHHVISTLTAEPIRSRRTTRRKRGFRLHRSKEELRREEKEEERIDALDAVIAPPQPAL